MAHHKLTFRIFYLCIACKTRLLNVIRLSQSGPAEMTVIELVVADMIEGRISIDCLWLVIFLQI